MRQILLMAFVAMILSSCGKKAGAAADPQIVYGDRQYRAITGISMGAFGANSLFFAHPELFGTVGALGGPVDIGGFLAEVEQMMRPFDPNDSTRLSYDQWRGYPARDGFMSILKDIGYAFGNPLCYNPDSTFYPPASLKEPGKGFNILNPEGQYDLIDFLDVKENTPYDSLDGMPNGRGDGKIGQDEELTKKIPLTYAVDLNGDGTRNIVYDTSDNIISSESVITCNHEPYTDTDVNGRYDEGEPYTDSGLDGVAGTADYGEGNGRYDISPNWQRFLDHDPLTNLTKTDPDLFRNTSYYMDVGSDDEFGLLPINNNFFATATRLGFDTKEFNGFPYDEKLDIPTTKLDDSQFPCKLCFFHYNGGHAGKFFTGIFRRFVTMFSFVSNRMPDGIYGVSDNDSDSALDIHEIESKMLTPGISRTVKYGVYLPAGYREHTDERYPVIYFLPGYGLDLTLLTSILIKELIDKLTTKGYLQKSILVIPDGFGIAAWGSFYVNHIDDTGYDNGQYEDYLIEELIPTIDATYRTRMK